MKGQEHQRPRSKKGGRRVSRSQTWQDQYERNRERYYPIFENLSAVLLDPRGYFHAIGQYLTEEFHRRVGHAVRGVLLLAAGVFLLFGSLTFFLFSAFLYLNSLILNTALTAFILGWASLILLFIVGYISIRQFRGIAGQQQRS